MGSIDPLEQHNILVVDDEQQICDMLSRHLRFQGFPVDTASNGAEALERMSVKRYDLVITDIMMPVMDGVALLHEIRDQYPMVHCIIITGQITLDNILTCMRLSADYCIYKPLEDLGELEECVRKSLNQIEHWTRKLKTLRTLKG